MALQDSATYDIDDGFVLTIERVKMRRIVIAEIHVNQNAKKTR